jgi:hypothetical protein
VVKKNDYPRKNFSKDGVQTGEPANANPQQKSFQRDSDVSHKENHIRNNRPPRDNQQRDNANQRDFSQQRDSQRRENRDNQVRDNSSRENGQNQHKDNYQRIFHRDGQNRENGKEFRENVRPHYQRPAIKPRAEETVADIAADITRIEKEIELQLKEIRSMRLGV